MSSAVRLQVVFSIYKTQWVGSIIEKLLARLTSSLPGVLDPGTENPDKKSFPPFLFLHFPSRVLPSTWGGGLGSRGAQTDKDNVTGLATVLSAVQVEALHSLLRSGHVGLISAGYSGAMHPLLHGDEIVHDAEWGLSNPWRSGFKDHFGAIQPVFMPFWPEAGRPAIRASDASGFAYWCDGLSRNGNPKKLVFSEVSGKRRTLDYLRIPENSNPAQSLKLIKNASEKNEPRSTNLLVHYSCTIDNFENCIESLALAQVKQFTFANELIDEQSSQNGENHFPLDMTSHHRTPLSPRYRSKIGQFAVVRRTRAGGQERIRGLLIDADPDQDGNEVPSQAAPEPKLRSLLANMQGNTLLMSDSFDTEFQNGFCQAFRSEGRRIVFRSEPGCEIRFGQNKRAFETESAVSFETDQTRGLRQSLRFVHADCKFPGRSLVDYFVADRSSYLLVDFSLRYPWFSEDREISSLVPLRFTIDFPEGCESVKLERKHSDGTVVETSFSLAGETSSYPKVLIDRLLHNAAETEQHYFLPGSRWILRWKDQDQDRGLVVGLPDFENGVCLPMELAVFPGEKPKLQLLPEGTYRSISSKDITGVSQHLALSVFPLFGADAVIPELSSSAERELSPSYIVRQV